MMIPQSALPTTSADPPDLDYAYLRQAGIRYLERLAGHVWTDFNAHDPGITILEQVCYALTDLAYRINYDIPDLLYGEGTPEEDGFYSPSEILTTRPVTANDLRKLLIDINGIKNAWVTADTRPIDQPDFYYNDRNGTLDFAGSRLKDEPVFLKGLYQVAVEFEDTLHLASMNQARDKAWQEVMDRLQRNRGLGEDFSRVNRLEAQYVQVLAYIEIAAIDNPEKVLLDIYEQLSEHISPSIPFYSLSQMLERGKRIDEIYDGPPLNHGFIDDDDLEKAQRRTVLRTSDLIQAIMDATGVKAVRYVQAGVNVDFAQAPNTTADGTGTEFQVWSLDLDSNKAPKLDVKKSAIILERNGLPVAVNLGAVQVLYETRLKQVMNLDARLAADNDIQPPKGRDRHVGDYYSIQHQFPVTYGIGSIGLPASATPQRQAQAKQLKAYLLFFDQLLANYFAQLAHVKDLFSFSGSSSQTYFAQVIDDPSLGLAGIRRDGHEARVEALNNMTETDAPAAADRRNRFLNHLLARFAERFTDYALLLFGSQTDQGKLIQDKQAFLQDYPALSSARGTAYNYLEPGSAANRAGLEKRIRHKLGIETPDEDFILVENILLRPMAGDTGQEVPFLTGSSHKDPYSLRLSFAFPDSVARYSNKAFKKFVENTVRDESPAHLSVDIQWLDADRMAVLKAVYPAWLEKRRAYWAEVDFSRENSDEPR